MIIVNGVNPNAPYIISLYQDMSSITRHECGTIASRNVIRPTLHRPNFIFRAMLELVEHQKTKSGTSVFIMRCMNTSIEFSMYPDDFTNMVRKKDCRNGVFRGIWTFRKLGPCLGLVSENSHTWEP